MFQIMSTVKRIHGPNVGRNNEKIAVINNTIQAVSCSNINKKSWEFKHLSILFSTKL